MFVAVFDWLCNALTSIFDLMKRFTLFETFTYYDFCIGLIAVPIIFKIINFIMGIEDEEGNIQPRADNIKRQYDSNNWNKYNNRPIVAYSWYKPRHRASYRYSYVPKHTMKGRHGK